jgi:hypothetical protein
MKFIKSKKQLILIFFLVFVLVGVGGFLIYASDYYRADSIAKATLSPTNSYKVSNTANFITFTPNQNQSTTGVIIYPGAKVEADSYSVIASQLATNGFTTIIVKMPFNLAFFGMGRADQVIANHPEITSWVMMGHSLGGVFASEYALNHQDKVKGVIYLSAYPNTNSSNATFKALSLRGSLDGITSPEDISNNLYKFPSNTTFITIDGGNHYNFGDYGVQTGDSNSTITKSEQQNLTVAYIIEFLGNI